MAGVDDNVFLRKLYHAGKQLEHASDTDTGLLQALEKTELCLSMVKQSPSRSLRRVLRPSMITLVQEHLLRHQDIDVRLLVLNCVAQIIKIIAPAEPYVDEVTKEILELIVESFQDFRDKSSPSFEKRLFLLKIVEEMKLSTVMLNHGLADLVCEMCKHFFAAVSHHTYTADVYASMKNIMTFVLEESDEISQELLSVFLINLRREMRDSSPAAHSLATDVFAHCVVTLRPYLREKFPSEQAIHCKCLDGYHEIVHDMFRRRSQEINRTAADQEAVVTDISSPEPSESIANDPNSQVASCPVSPFGRHNESSNDNEMSDSEADVRLVRLFSEKYSDPFPDFTSGRKRRRAKKRSEVKEDDSLWGARVATESEGISSPRDTVGESADNVSVSRSLKVRRTAARNSARKKRSLKEIETSEDSSTDED